MKNDPNAFRRMPNMANFRNMANTQRGLMNNAQGFQRQGPMPNFQNMMAQQQGQMGNMRQPLPVQAPPRGIMPPVAGVPSAGAGSPYDPVRGDMKAPPPAGVPGMAFPTMRQPMTGGVMGGAGKPMPPQRQVGNPMANRMALAQALQSRFGGR